MAKGEGAGEKSGSPGGEAGEGESAQAGEPSASQMLKQGAQALRQAASQLQLRPGSSKNSQMAGQPGQPGEGQKGGQQGGGRGANERPRIVDMQTHLKNLSARNWGQLPGTLQTEILQSTRKRPDGEYARLIRLYFEDISRAQGTPSTNREEEAN
jgi:hypothetical protein